MPIWRLRELPPRSNGISEFGSSPFHTLGSVEVDIAAQYTLPLKEAVERFRREPGATSNAYDWYREQAHRAGRVSMGDRRQLARGRGTDIHAVKVGRGWMVDPQEFDARMTEHRLARAEKHQITTDFRNNVLHGAPGTTLNTDFGSYTVFNDFHAARYTSVDRWEGGYEHWTCSRCWNRASTERNKPECHSCEDWGGCGRDCTLSRVFCEGCGTSLTRWPH